jgi:hypothetical protein
VLDQPKKGNAIQTRDSFFLSDLARESGMSIAFEWKAARIPLFLSIAPLMMVGCETKKEAPKASPAEVEVVEVMQQTSARITMVSCFAKRQPYSSRRN